MWRILFVLGLAVVLPVVGCSKKDQASPPGKEDPAKASSTDPTAVKPSAKEATVDASSDATIDALIEVVASDQDEAEYAIAELMEQGSEKPFAGKDAIHKALESKKPRTRIAAAIALFQLEPSNEETMIKVVDVVVRALTDPDPNVQREALALISRTKRANAEQIKAIAKALENDDEYVSSHAAYALAMMGERAVPLLIELTNNPKTVLLALLAISDIGDQAQSAQTAVAATTKDPDALVRREAALALGSIKADPAVAVPALESLLDDPAPMVQMAAAQALVPYAADAKSAVEKLTAMTKSENLYPRLIGALALIEIAPPSDEEAKRLAEILEAGLADDHRVARLESIKGLAKLRSASAIARPKLEQLAANDPDEEVKKAAAEAIRVISP